MKLSTSSFATQGGLSLKYRRECIGMLPKIYRLEVYRKKGFATIVEYASTLAGISKKQTYLTLNLEERLKDKPGLHQALSKGEVSINKLARIVSIATPENEEDLVEKVKLLPSRALEVFVRDERKSLHVQTLELEDDVKTELLELQNKGININELLREFLTKRKENLAQEKEKLAEEVYAKAEKHAKNSRMDTEKDKSTAIPNAIPKASRYIPAKIRRRIAQEHGTKCSIKACKKPSQQIHHTQRFSLSQNHDPHYLAPLCTEHHIIAHSIDQKYQQKRSG